ncbi:hypothetical protein BJV78DRAFT_548772 [Lactifluus subvellereus]|nr:hypothetical protein BJV78DRAFT_548772 [Lactifluus subvellereus]
MSFPYSSNPQQLTYNTGSGQSVSRGSGHRASQQPQPFQPGQLSGPQGTAGSVVPSTSGQERPQYRIRTGQTGQYLDSDSPPPTYTQATSPNQLNLSAANPFTPQSIEFPSTQVQTGQRFPPPPHPPPRAASHERYNPSVPPSTAGSGHRGRDSQFPPPPFPPPARSTSGQRPTVGTVFPPPDHPPPHTGPLTRRSPSQYHPSPVPSSVPHTTPVSSNVPRPTLQPSLPQRGRPDGQQRPLQQQPSRSGNTGFDPVSTLSQPSLSHYSPPRGSPHSPTSPVGPYSTQPSTQPYVMTPTHNQANPVHEPPHPRYPHATPFEPNVASNSLPSERSHARPNAPPVQSTPSSFQGASQPTRVSPPHREHPRPAAAIPTCIYPNCSAPVIGTRTGEPTEYCGEGHMLAAVQHLGIPECPACHKYPRRNRGRSQFCGSACEAWAARQPREEQQLPGSSRSHSATSNAGHSTWNHANAPGWSGSRGGESHYASRQYSP